MIADIALQFENTANSIADVILLMTDEGEITWANGASASAIGRPAASLAGRSILNLLTPASAEIAERALLRLRERRASDALHELEFVCSNLTPCHLEVRFSTLAEGRGGVAAVGRGTTERRKLQEQNGRAQFRTFQFQAALVELAASQPATLDEAFRRLTGVAAATLDAARVGVWLFNAERSQLRCAQLFDREAGRYRDGMLLHINRYAAYFDAAERGRTIAASDADTDPRTSELADGPRAGATAGSILDVPIRWDGRVAGILSFEHAGERRYWSTDERHFAASVADLTSLALETDRRRRAESEAQQTLAQLELFFSQSLDGFFFMMLDEPIHWGNDPEEGGAKEQLLDHIFDHQRVVKVNDAMLRQYGVSRESLLGATPRELFAHAPEHGKDLWRRMLDAGRLHAESDERRADGSQMWVEGDYICFYDSEGRVTGHFGIQRDITERKAADEALRKMNQEIARHAAELEVRVAQRTTELSRINAELRDSEERLAGVFHSAMDAIVVFDRNGTITMLNSAAEKTFRCTREQALGHSVDTLLTGELFGCLKAFMQDEREESLWAPEGHHARRSDGEVFPIEVSVSRARLSSNVLFTMVLRDVNEKKNAEEHLDRLQRQNVYLREEIQHEHNFEEIIGNSSAMREVFRNIEMVAGTDSIVLLLGETGTGKELIAHAVHNRSKRRSNAMIKVNCAALPANLVESELFGHERGAFTGAVAQKKGRFELANRGTIFLDEVGELPLETQTKLLRVLQEQEFERVGGSQSIRVDTRIIAATNRDLAKEVLAGAFRADLFYRLNVFPIFVPPLRERKEDIERLTSYFVRKSAERMGKRIDSISPDVIERLQRYDWPGNVRELANLIERAVILCQGNTLRASHIALPDARPVSPTGYDTIPTLEDAERLLILRALQRTGGVLAGPAGAAELLGINRSTLWSRMRKLGVEVPNARRA